MVVISLTTGTNCTCSSKNNGKDKEFELYFLTICRFVIESCEKTEDNCIPTTKFTSCYSINILYRLRRKNVGFFSLNFALSQTFRMPSRDTAPIKTCKVRHSACLQGIQLP